MNVQFVFVFVYFEVIQITDDTSETITFVVVVVVME